MSHRRWSALVCATMAAVLVSACGGGGGGSSSEQPALTFTPSSLSVAEGDPGIALPLTVRVRPNFTTSGSIYVMVSDTQGVLGSPITLTAQSDGAYVATFSTAPLAAGHYAGTFDVKLCPVDTCAQQFPGSPVKLAYDFQVGTTPNLTSLSALAGAADWETYQSNVAHTGYVPVSLDPTRFSTRWRWTSSDAGVKVSPPVVANGTVFVTTSGYFAPTSRLVALREQDGLAEWSHNFGAIFAANPPAVSGGAVYVATTGHSDTAMWSFDASSGAQRFRTAFNSQWEHYAAPAVSSGKVYSNAGSYGGIQSFDTTTGASDWFTQLSQFDQWTPALDSQYAYANMAGIVTVMRRSDGVQLAQLLLPDYSWNGYSSYAMPVLVGDGRVLVRSNGDVPAFAGSNSLSLVNAMLSGTAWSVTGSFVTDPVIAGGTVYIANGATRLIEARDISDGHVLWSWPLPVGASSFVGNLLVTDGHLFVSTNLATHALSLSSHSSVWSSIRVGHKAMSANGVLYISTTLSDGTSDGGLSAINLH